MKTPVKKWLVNVIAAILFSLLIAHKVRSNAWMAHVINKSPYEKNIALIKKQLNQLP